MAVVDINGKLIEMDHFRYAMPMRNGGLIILMKDTEGKFILEPFEVPEFRHKVGLPPQAIIHTAKEYIEKLLPTEAPKGLDVDVYLAAIQIGGMVKQLEEFHPIVRARLVHKILKLLGLEHGTNEASLLALQEGHARSYQEPLKYGVRAGEIGIIYRWNHKLADTIQNYICDHPGCLTLSKTGGNKRRARLKKGIASPAQLSKRKRAARTDNPSPRAKQEKKEKGHLEQNEQPPLPPPAKPERLMTKKEVGEFIQAEIARGRSLEGIKESAIQAAEKRSTDAIRNPAAWQRYLSQNEIETILQVNELSSKGNS